MNTNSSKGATTILLVILILAAGYFGVYSFWNNLNSARANFDIVKTENDKLKKAQADMNAFIAKYNSNRAQAEMANRALPVGDPDVAILLDNFSKLTAESKISLLDFNVTEQGSSDESTVPNGVQPVEVTAQMVGNYESFKDFLLRMQRNLRLMDIMSVEINLDEGANDGGRTMRFTLRLRTYYQQ
jgi:Tfp pilus assembly protein PilO